jgi:hypothetical protein
MKTQNISRLILLALCVALLLAVPCAFAQDNTAQNATAQNTAAQNTPADQNAPAYEPAPDTPWYANTDGAYSVSLGTGQLISLYPPVRNDQTIPNGEYVEGQQSVALKSKDYKYQMFYGVSAYSVYTNSIGGVGTGSDTVSTSINPYVALFVPTKTGRYLLQYSTVVNPNDTQSGGPQAYHSLTASAMGSLSPRWYWIASTSGSYGSESARLQGPLSFLVVQSTPIADTTSAAVLQRAANVAFTESTLGLGWLKSRRDRISLSVSHFYSGIEGDSSTTPPTAGTHTHSLGEKLEYSRSLTQRIDLRSYGQADEVLNGPTCETFGGGLGIAARVSHSVTFNIQGGPQWTTASCGSPLSANFSASLVKNFGNRDRIYASVSRQFSTIAGLDSHWEDDATVGFTKGLGRFTLTTDAGYLRGDALTTVVPAYHGYYVAPRVRYKVTNSMGLSAGYRSFHGSGGNLVTGNLSYAVVGVEWYPAPLHFR